MKDLPELVVDSEGKPVLDENGKVIEAAKRLIDGKYRYVRLASDQNVITLINEVDEVIKIAENENFIISKVLYDFGSDEINEVAALELDKLVVILQKNKHVGVELSSHTDSKGTEKRNMQLSQRRANAAVKYQVGDGNFDDISAIIVVLTGRNNETITLYKHQYTLSVLKAEQGALNLFKSNNRLSELDSNILKIDPNYVFLKLESKYYVENVKTLETYLGFHDVIKDSAANVLRH